MSPSAGLLAPPRHLRLQRPAPALCPVTALAFYRLDGTGKLFILAAEDGWLSVYGASGPPPDSAENFNASGHRCHGRLLVFSEQSIQGLRVGGEDGGGNGNCSYGGDVLIWGGQSVALVSAARMKALLLQQPDGSEIKPQQQQTHQIEQLALSGPQETRAHDRVYDALLLPLEDSSSCASGRIGALITAHNEVVPFFVKEEEAKGSSPAGPGPVIVLEHPISFSRPVLYSARLAWTDGNGLTGRRRRLLAAAGTVFGEIVVWTCQLPLLPTDRREDDGSSSNSSSSDIRMLGTFTGHEGSIFDVALSPEFCLSPPSNGNKSSSASSETMVRLLVSCSDDRTIRVWPLFLGHEEDGGQHSTVPAPVEQRETGYQNTFTDAHDREIEYHLQQQQQQQKQNHSTPPSPISTSSPALAVVMAHASRIWHVHFGAVARKSSAPTSALPGIFLYSFGEDAAVQEWFLQVDWSHLSAEAAAEQAGATSSLASLEGFLHHCRTLENHVGKNLWAAAVFLPSSGQDMASERPLVATSGGDGQICLFRGGNNGEMAGPKTGGGDPSGDSPFSSSNIVTCVLPPRTTLSKHEPPTSEEFLRSTSSVAVASADHECQSEPTGVDDDYVAALSEAISLPTKKGSQKRLREELFNSYAFLSEKQMLAVTTHGRLLLGSIDHHADSSTSAGTRSTSAWVEVPGVPEEAVLALQDYNVVRSPRGGGGGGMATAGSCAEGLAVIGNARGRLFLYSVVAGLQELSTRLPGKVEEMLFLPAGASASPKTNTAADSTTTTRLQMVASVLFSNQATVIDMEVETARGTIVSERCRAMPLPRRSPSSPSPSSVTAASRCGSYIAVGSRYGQICLYAEVVDSDGVLQLQMQAQAQTRTRDAILSIVPLPPPRRHFQEKSGGGEGDYNPSFVVAARDGTYRIYEAVMKPSETNVAGNSAAAAPFLCLRHETAPPFGPIVRDAWFVHASDLGDAAAEPPELILCGFRSTKFVVWNETRQQELATVDCGGTHRTYTFMVSSFCHSSSSDSRNPGRLRFAFTRNSGLHVFAQNASITVRAKTGGHGREIKGASASASGTYVATGGEDTVVRIWTGNGGSGSVDDSQRRCLAVLKLHNTGLHSLAWLGDHRLLSAAGSEELFVWRVARLDSTYEGLAVTCESAYPAPQNSDKTLRITGTDASYGSELGGESDDDRDGSDGSDGRSAYVSLALSNSVIKTYRYTPPGTWQLLAQGHYTGACPTQLRHLHMRESGELVVLAAFADGSLSVWRASATATDTKTATYTLIPAAAAPVHRNAIKSLSLSRVWKTSARPWLAVLTGGDDNAIAVTQLSWSSDHGPSPDSYALHKTYRVSNAHAAALAGIQIVAQAGGNDDDSGNSNANANANGSKSLMVVSCSNDQRVKAWRVLLPEPQPRRGSSCGLKGHARIQLLEDNYSAIADAAGLEGIRGPDGKISSVLVVGMGMESWRIAKGVK